MFYDFVLLLYFYLYLLMNFICLFYYCILFVHFVIVLLFLYFIIVYLFLLSEAAEAVVENMNDHELLVSKNKLTVFRAQKKSECQTEFNCS